MKGTKVLIINYNRLTLPKNMAEWVVAHGCDPVFIDNASDYPPLLEYYKNSPFKVIRMSRNHGHTVIWKIRNIIRALNITDRFIMTDPDLDLSGIPGDFLSVLNNGLDKYAGFDKCALSLEIEDLPDTAEGNFIREHEAEYWTKPLDEDYFYADTDTTFALYRWPLGAYGHSAIRTNRPYTAKHVPWYYRNLRDIPEDEKYYFKSATASSSGKQRLEQL
jgi:hypothetical protein